MPDWLSKEFAAMFGDAVNDIPWLAHEASSRVVNAIVGETRTRPHPWSAFSDYTSWQGLTDRTYLARHLPPVAPPPDLPAIAAIQKLFTRPPGGQRLSDKSTCLFPAFAQYLTDGFIRTDPTNPGKTTSNHEIDLCPLYGRTPAQTKILRLVDNTKGRRGRLKSQMLSGEEYAPFLYIDGGSKIDPNFAALDPPLLGHGPSPSAARLATLFAFGGDRANSTPFSAMMNTLLLREHNRVAGQLDLDHPDWDDDRVFETARNILIPIYIKLVIEEYINHITPLPFRLIADPSVAWTAEWNRPNWMTVEFSLLYRWHSLIPDQIVWSDGVIPTANFGLDNAPLIRVGLGKAFSAASAQKASELGAFNTADALLPIEEYAIAQARSNRIDTYNNYRHAFGMDPATKFADITSNPEVASLLEGLYRTPDKVEFYPGLFAEDRVANTPLPELILRMVAVDAFSQALTNPLLSQHIYNAATFTDWGLKLIEDTHSLADILARNNVAVDGPIIMTQAGWKSV